MNEQNAVMQETCGVSFTDSRGFELAQRAARLISSTTLVPKDYQGNIANCAVALNMAHRIGADPLMVMQNLIIVHGRPTWSAQFLIATFNTCGKFSALRYEFFGEQRARIKKLELEREKAIAEERKRAEDEKNRMLELEREKSNVDLPNENQQEANEPKKLSPTIAANILDEYSGELFLPTESPEFKRQINVIDDFLKERDFGNEASRIREILIDFVGFQAEK